ncbi:protein-export membrane protein secD [Nonlabens ulvanivorans]|nr:protein-export membrane protein secD [Nonlabens ulvanivorans]
MVFYYGRAGLYADIALVVNILFIFGALASLKAVLTLPGIAGIVLTIGISVDANVLIFERIREELAKGKSQADSIKDGFNNALSSILDANITTFLTALILFIFGTGPIQGFATTLMIGILTSLFTAIFITRLFIDGYGKNGKSLAFSTPITKNWFRNVNIDFLKKRKVAYMISLAFVLISAISLFTKSLNFGIDFSGGRTYTVRFEQPVNATEVTKMLSAEDVFGSAEAKTYGSDNQLKISTKYGIDGVDAEVTKEIEDKLFANLKQYMPADMDMATFVDVSKDDKQYGIMSNFQVGPTIADDILTGSLYAIFGSLIVVFLYILIRFRKWQFSLGAVIAVFHDVLIVLGIFSLTYDILPFNMEIDQAFIAAILTVIGYSLNDTVVVFDRIREFINERTNWEFARTVNAAISSTISRTLNTSLTTLIVLLAIFTFGGESIQGFMLALIIGVLVGTYSSVFIATPIMFDTMEKSNGKLLPKEPKPAKEEL